MKLLLMVSFYYAVANSRALNKNCSSTIDPNEDFLLVNDSYYDTYTLDEKQSTTEAIFNNWEIHFLHDEEYSGDYDHLGTMSDKNYETEMKSHQNKEYSGDNDQLETESRDGEYSGNYGKSGMMTHQHKEYYEDYYYTKIDDEDLLPDTHLISNQAIFNNLEIHVFQDEAHSGNYDQLGTMSDKNDESGKKTHQNKEYSGDYDQLETESGDGEYSRNYEESRTMTHQHKEYSGDYVSTKIDDENLLPDMYLTSNQAIFNSLTIHVFQDEEHSGDYDQLGTMSDKNDQSGMKSHQNAEYSGDNDQFEMESRKRGYSGNYEESRKTTHEDGEYSGDYDSTKIDDEDLLPDAHLTSNQAIFNNLEIHVFQDEEHSGDYDQLGKMSDKNDESGMKSQQNKEYSGDYDQLETESRDGEYSGNYEEFGTMTHQHKEYSGDYDSTKIDDEDLLPDMHFTSNQAIFNNLEIHVFQDEEHSGDYDQLGTMSDKNDQSGMKSHQNAEYSGDNDQFEMESRKRGYSGNYEESRKTTHEDGEYSGDYDSTKMDDEDLLPDMHLISNQVSNKPPEKSSSLSHQEDKHVEHRDERKKGGGGGRGGGIKSLLVARLSGNQGFR